MRDRFVFFGIGTQKRRQAVADVLSRRPLDWDFVQACWQAEEREMHYVAIDHLRRHRLAAADLPRVRALIESNSWWDSVDHLAKVAGTALADAPSAARPTICAWARAKSFWTRRAAILSQLGFKHSTDTALLAECVTANLGSDEFFINKAIGWALRDYTRTNPEWVLDFADDHALSTLSRREALKHVDPRGV